MLDMLSAWRSTYPVCIDKLECENGLCFIYYFFGMSSAFNNIKIWISQEKTWVSVLILTQKSRLKTFTYIFSNKIIANNCRRFWMKPLYLFKAGFKGQETELKRCCFGWMEIFPSKLQFTRFFEFAKICTF